MPAPSLAVRYEAQRKHYVYIYHRQGSLIVHGITGKILVNNIESHSTNELIGKIVEFNLQERRSFYQLRVGHVDPTFIDFDDVGYWFEENGEVHYQAPSEDFRNGMLRDYETHRDLNEDEDESNF